MISTHILDLGKGSPAAGITIRLLKKNVQQWQELAKGVTNADGRLSFDIVRSSGLYQLVFETERYLNQLGADPFLADVPVVFKIEDLNRNYHVPILLSAFGYSIYRGS